MRGFLPFISVKTVGSDKDFIWILTFLLTLFFVWVIVLPLWYMTIGLGSVFVAYGIW